jgi:hypothetical protein
MAGGQSPKKKPYSKKTVVAKTPKKKLKKSGPSNTDCRKANGGPKKLRS